MRTEKEPLWWEEVPVEDDVLANFYLYFVCIDQSSVLTGTLISIGVWIGAGF